ncbi:MAG: hypothetical protein Q8P93_00055 [bacterium]|nr:hypothetical protein [bacterium]
MIDGTHVDQYGHVNYKAIATVLEPFQDELLARQETSFELIESEMSLRSFVKKLEITWHRELKQGEECVVLTRLELGNTSMKFFQEIHVLDDLAATLFMVVVLVDSEGKSAPIPPRLREMLF